MNNYPKIYNNDIKVLGRVVSIATENKVAAAEQIFDERFNYSGLDNYSWDNADFTKEGLDLYTINRILGRKLKYLDDRIRFDNDGWIIRMLPWKNKVEQDLSGLDSRISHLEECCEQVTEILNNLPTGAGDASFTVSPKSVDLAPGETAQITVTKGADLTGTVRFTSNNTSVATVSANGVITAVADGTTTITVSVDGFRQTQDVTVTVTTPTPTYRVTFNPNNGQPSFYQDKLEGEKLVAVTDPVNEGYTFNGWHVNSDTGVVWDFDDPVTSTMTLIAGWTANENPQLDMLTVEFNSMGGSSVPSQQVVRGGIATRPVDPTRSGYSFVNWHIGSIDGNVYTFAETVTSNITLYAEWSLNPTYSLIITAAGDKRNLLKEETVALTATIVNDNNPSDTRQELITWSSNNDAALGVNSTGQMTAVATANNVAPSVTITATSASGLTGQLTFVITDPTISPESLSVLGETIHVGENKSLTVSVLPSGASYSLTYESKNTSIFTVDAQGFITGMSIGEANVEVTTQNGVSGTARIEVIAAPIVPTSITVTPATSTIYIGSGVDGQHPNTVDLSAVVNPSGASQVVRWESQNPTVANVSNGQSTTEGVTVTALSVGETNIYAHSYEHDDVVGTAHIVVQNIDAPEPQPETSLIIEPVFPNNEPNAAWGYDSSDNLQLMQRTSGLFNAYVRNNTTGTKSPISVTWSSSVENVRVHPGGDVNDAANTGTGTFTLFVSDLVDPSTNSVTITATSNDYGSVSQVVNLLRATSEPWPTTQLEVDDMTIAVGDVDSVNVSVWRPNINEDGKLAYSGTYSTSDGSITTPQFTTSDSSVFTVDQDGHVTAVGEGLATLTMKTHYLSTDFNINYASVNHVAETWNEGVSATATITVTSAQSGGQTEP